MIKYRVCGGEDDNEYLSCHCKLYDKLKFPLVLSFDKFREDFEELKRFDKVYFSYRFEKILAQNSL